MKNLIIPENPFDCHVCNSPTKVTKIVFETNLKGNYFMSTKTYQCIKCNNSFEGSRKETKKAIMKVKNRYNDA